MLAVFARSFALLGDVPVNSDATVESLDSMPSFKRAVISETFREATGNLRIFSYLAPSKAHKGKFLHKICFEMVYFSVWSPSNG